jgi:hypothetical protein
VLVRDHQLTPGPREYLLSSPSQGPPAYSRAPGVPTTVSKWIEKERFISIDDSFISIDDSFISIDENRSHIDSHVFFVLKMVILSSYAHFNVEMDE